MPLRLLVIDDNRDASSVLGRSLAQRFPQAEVREFASFAAVRDELLRLPLEGTDHIAIAGRVADLDLLPLVRAIRVCHCAVPVIAMGEAGMAAELLQAGANRFLDYEAWLLLGPTIERLVGAKPAGV